MEKDKELRNCLEIPNFPAYLIHGIGPCYKIPIKGMPGFVVKIDDEDLECVAFLGFEDNSPGKGGINCIGTGFFLTYKGGWYLVTAKHVAKILEDAPFLLRINKTDGMSENYPADGVTWYYHSDDNVDIAVTPCHIGQKDIKHKRIYEVSYWKESKLITNKHIEYGFVGNGDQCYTIGLFRLHSGRKRNLPVVHTGNIALLKSNEKIPVVDWDDPKKKKNRFVDAYIIQSQSLEGLSGSPVLARYTIDIPVDVPDGCIVQEGKQIRLRLPSVNLGLLGVWQGAWKLPPDEAWGIDQTEGKTVPVGMGIVIPAFKIIEVLEMDELAEKRREEPSGIIAVTPEAAPKPFIPTNPQHKEDFKFLVSAAAKKKLQADETYA